jgi:hypothetical protein
MELQPKYTLEGHPFILGRPWLADVDAYIVCRLRDMTVSQGNSTKKLTLYPPADPRTNPDTPIWIGNEDINEDNSLQILTLA